MNVYFDNASTTAVRSEAAGVMMRVMKNDYGNPSSSHTPGRHAKIILEDSRSVISRALGTKPDRVIFTSGGTEANNLAIFAVLQNRRLAKAGKHIITSAVEHDSVLNPVKKLESDGWDVTYLNPDDTGRIPVSAFKDALRDDTVFASLMLVNNETGAVNPVSGYAQEIKRRGLCTVLHTDAVQGFCKIPFSVKTPGAGLISVSAHKFHGPKGAGALYASDNVRLTTLVYGGGQERGLRHGTEALPAIAGFAEAVKLSIDEIDDDFDKIRSLRNFTAKLLKSAIPDVLIIGDDYIPDMRDNTQIPCSPYILCLSLPCHKSEVLMTYLDIKGIYVSKGSACKKGARSHVLEAMKLPDKVINGALRVSFSRYSTQNEAEYFVDVLKNAAEKIVH